VQRSVIWRGSARQSNRTSDDIAKDLHDEIKFAGMNPLRQGRNCISRLDGNSRLCEDHAAVVLRIDQVN
jgi:hypothetical protein